MTNTHKVRDQVWCRFRQLGPPDELNRLTSRAWRQVEARLQQVQRHHGWVMDRVFVRPMIPLIRNTTDGGLQQLQAPWWMRHDRWVQWRRGG